MGPAGDQEPAADKLNQNHSEMGGLSLGERDLNTDNLMNYGYFSQRWQVWLIHWNGLVLRVY